MKRLLTRVCLASIALLASIAPGALGCSGNRDGFDQAFTKRWQSDHGASATRLYERLQGQKPSPGTQLVVGVAEQGLVAKGIGTGSGWSYAGNVDSIPQISGNVVALSSGHQVVALDASSGKLLWKLDAGKRRLRGIGDDGTYTAVSLGDAKGTEPSRFVIVERDGQIAHSYELRAPIGVPATVSGIAFVPWDSQYVTALDAKTGDEVGRILLRHQVSNARNIGGELYFGQLGLTKFDDKIGSAQRKAGSYVSLPSKQVPGDPEWYKDGTQVYRPSDSASTKINLFARPTSTDQGLGIAGNTYTASYFSVVLGLDAKDGSLRWTHPLDNDIVGGAAASDGFALCDASGKLWGISSQGSAPAELVDLGKPIVACVVQADKLGTTAPASASLAEQIQAVLSTHRPSLATAYSFLVEELPHVDDPLVTKILIDLIEHPRTVPSLAKRAGVLLAEQRTGVEYMLSALERHYDFLSGHRPPPVGPLAKALAALEYKRAAAPLAKHLNDPATSAKDVALIANALYALGTSSEAEELKTFFALYRATADQAPLVEAVVRVAQTLVRVGGPSGQAMVEFAATDPLTHPAVRSKLAELIHPKRRKPPKPKPDVQGKLSEARN